MNCKGSHNAIRGISYAMDPIIIFIMVLRVVVPGTVVKLVLVLTPCASDNHLFIFSSFFGQFNFCVEIVK